MTEFTKREGYSLLGLMSAAFAGAVVGAAIATLVAPKTGEQTRAQLKDLAMNAKRKLARSPRAFKDAALAGKEDLLAGTESEAGITTH